MIGNPQHFQRHGVGPEKTTKRAFRCAGMLGATRPALHSLIGSAMQLI
jgi:hypothetical protein